MQTKPGKLRRERSYDDRHTALQ